MNTDQVLQWKNKILEMSLEKGPKILIGIAIIVVGALVARFVGRFAQIWLNKRRLEPPVRLLFTRLVKLFIIVMFAVVALGTAGIDTAPLIAGIGVAGVGIGLAMQGVLGNLVCGLLIIFTRPFRVGEYIELIGVHGQVQSIDLFATILVHADRSLVIIPNRKIVGEVLHNYGTVRQHDLSVGVSFDTDLNKALSIVRGVLERNDKILKDPVPVVAVVGFGDSCINIGIRPWSELKYFAAVRAEVYLAVSEAFRAAQIQIPFPQREIHVVNTGSTPGAVH